VHSLDAHSHIVYMSHCTYLCFGGKLHILIRAYDAAGKLVEEDRLHRNWCVLLLAMVAVVHADT